MVKLRLARVKAKHPPCNVLNDPIARTEIQACYPHRLDAYVSRFPSGDCLCYLRLSLMRFHQNSKSHQPMGFKKRVFTFPLNPLGATFLTFRCGIPSWKILRSWRGSWRVGQVVVYAFAMIIFCKMDNIGRSSFLNTPSSMFHKSVMT